TRGAAVDDAGDIDVVHHGQGLPFGLEAGDDLAAVHARLDDLQRDLALHGLGLLGHVDGSHAALADLLQQLVRPDDRTRGLGHWRQINGSGWPWAVALEEATYLRVCLKQPLNTTA